MVDAYLGVLRAQDNLEASKAQERAFERQLEQTQQRFEVGLIAITDVYEAQAAYDLSQGQPYRRRKQRGGGPGTALRAHRARSTAT